MKKIVLWIILVLFLTGCTGAFFSVKKNKEKKGEKRVVLKNKKEDKLKKKTGKIIIVEKTTEVKENKPNKKEKKVVVENRKKQVFVKKRKKIVVKRDTEKKRKISFRIGEKYQYSIQYLLIKAGKAILEIPSYKNIRGKKCYWFHSKAVSVSPFSLVFKVDDRIDAYLDAEKYESVRITKHIREGKYKRDDLIDFLQEKKMVKKIKNSGEPKYIKTLPNVLDILSAFFMFRYMPLEVGKSYSLPVYDIEKSYYLKVKVLSKEVVKTPVGRFLAYKVSPDLKSMGLFKHKGVIFIWISADKKRIPLLVRSTVKIGAVYVVLEKME